LICKKKRESLGNIEVKFIGSFPEAFGRVPLSSISFSCRIGNSIISRNRHNRYEKIDLGLIVREQGIKKSK